MPVPRGESSRLGRLTHGHVDEVLCQYEVLGTRIRRHAQNYVKGIHHSQIPSITLAPTASLYSVVTPAVALPPKLLGFVALSPAYPHLHRRQQECGPLVYQCEYLWRFSERLAHGQLYGSLVWLCTLRPMVPLLGVRQLNLQGRWTVTYLDWSHSHCRLERVQFKTMRARL